MNDPTDNRSRLTSIIVPCWNQVEFTRHCIRALLRCTRPPWELIVINNGSTDGTGGYLAGVQDSAAVPVAVIANSINVGFPAAINQGLKIASGEYFVLLNNDAVVTEGWLEQLIALTRVVPAEVGPGQSDGAGRGDADGTQPPALAVGEGGETCGLADGGDPSGARRPEPNGAVRASDASGSADTTPCADGASDARGRADTTPSSPPFKGGAVGLAGPMTNYAPPPQLIERVPYRDLGEMHAFARQWREEHRGQWFTVPKLSGFCLLMKRAVYPTIGGLDEQFGLGLFDDDDLAIRARQAGFELAVAHDLFVHHFGGRTFTGNGVDTERLVDENHRRLIAKWGAAASQGRRIALRPFVPNGRERSRGDAETRRERGDPKAPDAADCSEQDPSPDVPGRLGTYVPAPPDISAAPPLRVRPVRVSLTMIVRDEEKNLPHCLNSVAGLFDEIVIVDTGSKDRTREIAQQFGARVFDFVWVGDFAAARNAALARATGDYAFWLDADDVIDPPERKKLEALLDSLGETASSWEGEPAREPRLSATGEGEPPCEPHLSASREGEPPCEPHLSATREGEPPCELGPGASRQGRKPARAEPRPPGAAYVVKCSCDPAPNGDGGQTVVDHVRLFPLHENVRWTYRVHEQILPALRRAGISVNWTGITVRHTGYTDPALRARKLDRDCKILHEELAERPHDPFVLFNLGAIAGERREWRQALDYWRQSLGRSAPSDSITRKLFAQIARAHQMLGEPAQAIATCAEGLAVCPDDAELFFREAMVRRHIGDRDGAERRWRRILTLKRPEEFASLDQGIYSHLTRRNLAALARERGDHSEETELWRAVLAECPNDREALAHLKL